jgi:hypothetical protein
MAQAQLNNLDVDQVIDWLEHGAGELEMPMLVHIRDDVIPAMEHADMPVLTREPGYDTPTSDPAADDTTSLPTYTPPRPSTVPATLTSSSPSSISDLTLALRQQYYRTRDAPVVIKKAKNVNIWLNAPPQGTVSIANVTNNS